MVLLPRTYPPSARTASRPKQNGTKADEQPISPPQILLLASPTGVLATLHPLPDAAHRRLSSLATALAASLPHPAGLNPRVYRAAALLAATGMPPGVDPTAGYGGGVFSVAGGGGASAKSILDGTLLARWNELGTARRAEAAWRAGYAEGVASSVGAASALGERQVQTSTAANGDSAVSGAQGAGEAGGLGTTAAGPAIGMLGARAVREELRVEGGGWGALAYF